MNISLQEHFLSAFVPCESTTVAFTLGQTNHLYLSHGEQLSYNKIITNLSAEFHSPLFAEDLGSMLSIFFLWHTHKVERGLSSLKIQVMYVLYLATHHMVMLMQETQCFSI